MTFLMHRLSSFILLSSTCVRVRAHKYRSQSNRTCINKDATTFGPFLLAAVAAVMKRTQWKRTTPQRQPIARTDATLLSTGVQQFGHDKANLPYLLNLMDICEAVRCQPLFVCMHICVVYGRVCMRDAHICVGCGRQDSGGRRQPGKKGSWKMWNFLIWQSCCTRIFSLLRNANRDTAGLAHIAGDIMMRRPPPSGWCPIAA